MRFFCLFTLLFVCVSALAADALPRDVSNFLKLRESCDHWRGEDGYDEERQADINWSICQACPGTDAKLAKLKHKYKNQENILAKLNALELEIEPKNKLAARQFCKKARKPEWYQ
ncbi:hypothetical protein A7981_05045 [Methylovorus sp. MM2]|uniref:hypothetical protein n=1 Tax=Methylovorus sp. MM2 TaxID=1848038 RepID=UPI0007E21931|nr:hypothetical protein [Methylovorus sp. MM2]OAM52809.1 hypothetical protein A7981_05045 [Methylovorus sp. MM2]